MFDYITFNISVWKEILEESKNRYTQISGKKVAISRIQGASTKLFMF